MSALIPGSATRTRSLTRDITPAAIFALAVVLFWALNPEASRVPQHAPDRPHAHEPEHIAPVPVPTRAPAPRSGEPEMICERVAIRRAARS